MNENVNTAGVKVSALPESESFEGLFALGVDGNNRSVKVPLERVGAAADNATAAAESAATAAGAATQAKEDADAAAQEARGVVDTASAAVERMEEAIGNTEQAASAANGAAGAANAAASHANTAAEGANTAASSANGAAQRAEAAAERLDEVLDASTAATHPPYIENGSWMVWNPSHGKYENAGPATGSIVYPSFSINEDQELVVRDASPNQFRVEDGCLIYSTNR